MTMTAVAPRQVYEGAITPIGTDDEMLRAGGNADGPVFLLDGTTFEHHPAQRWHGAHACRRSSSTPAPPPRAARCRRGRRCSPAPEITTYDSAILFHPLELAVEHEIGVGVLESRIDMTLAGLLGNTSTRAMVLPGESSAAAQRRRLARRRGVVRLAQAAGTATTSRSPARSTTACATRTCRAAAAPARTPAATPSRGRHRRRRHPAAGRTTRACASTATIVANGGNGTGTISGGGAGGAIRLDRGAARRHRPHRRRAAAPAPSSTPPAAAAAAASRSATRSCAARSTSPPRSTPAAASMTGRSPAAPTAAAAPERSSSRWSTRRPPCRRRGGCCSQNPLEPARAALTPLPALGDGAVSTIDTATGVVVLDVARVRGDVVGDLLVSGRRPMAPRWAASRSRQQRRIADASAPGGLRVQLHVAATADELGEAASERALGHVVAFRGVSRLATVDAEALRAPGGRRRPAARADRRRRAQRPLVSSACAAAPAPCCAARRRW